MAAFRIEHLFSHPHFLPTVADAIYHAFWRERTGFSAATFENLLRQAADPDRIPLCLVALGGDQVLGTVNLIANDDEARPHLAPWLAALIVAPAFRGRGVGTALVQRVLSEAARLDYKTVYLGTDAPAFYQKLGARHIDEARAGLAVMAMDVIACGT